MEAEGVPLDLEAFEQHVHTDTIPHAVILDIRLPGIDGWQVLDRIPYGTTISYGELARNIGRPAASRAVGAANGRNPLAIVIPCHRVVGSDGSLTGYAGGVGVKKGLLERER